MFAFTVVASVVGLIMLLGVFRDVRVSAEIEIEASADVVWNALADFTAYSDWNPFIIKASGEMKAGSVIDVTIAVPVIQSMDFILTALQISALKRNR